MTELMTSETDRHQPARRPRIHYAWLLLMAAGLVSAISGTISYAFGIFLAPIAEGLGVSIGQTSLIYSIQFVAFAGGSLAIGWFTDHFGARKTIFVGSIFFLVSLVLSGWVNHLWQLYLFFGALLGAARTVFIVPVHTTITLWFQRKLPLAMGMVGASIGLGPLIFAPVIRQLITARGWQETLVWIGVVGGGLMIAGSLFIRNLPRDVGQRAYGAEEGSALAKAGFRPGVFYQGDDRNFVRKAMRTQPFTLLPVIHFLGCVSHAVPLVHVVNMGLFVGIDPLMAATFVGIISAASILSRFVISAIAEAAGGKKALALTLIIQSASILLLLVAHDAWVFYIVSFLFGFGFGGEMVCFPILNRQYYGSAPLGQVYGYQMLGAGLGMALGGYMGGALFDALGNYTGAILAASFIGFLSVAVTLRLTSPLPRRQPATALPTESRSASY